MKTIATGICFLLVLFILPSVLLADESLSPQLGDIFYRLWKDSAFGKDPNRTERAAWILEVSDRYELLRWPTSGARSQEFWRGPVPAYTIAQAHTHPANSQGEPSSNDIALCRKIGVPIYTISEHGIWVVTPDGAVRKLANSEWHRAPKAVAEREVAASATTH